MAKGIDIVTLGSLTKLMVYYIETNTEISIKNVKPN